MDQWVQCLTGLTAPSMSAKQDDILDLNNLKRTLLVMGILSLIGTVGLSLYLYFFLKKFKDISYL